MKKSTEELLKILKSSSDIYEYIESQEENLITETLEEQLNYLLDEKGLSKSDVVKRSGLDRVYLYQIFSGQKAPSRDKVLAISFGMNLTATETQSLLKAAGYSQLYPKIQRDSVILFGLEKRLSITDVNELLFDMNEKFVE